jgi:hypothetical protein
MTFYTHIGLDEPARYTIKFQGRVTGQMSDWFQVEYCQETEEIQPGIPVTSLTGVLSDQAALHGLLRQIRDLGLTLLYVCCISAAGESPGRDPSKARKMGIGWIEE